ncbi:MAG: magnesium transporter [Synoicihabitans sp.]
MSLSDSAPTDAASLLNRSFLLDFPREAARAIELMDPADAVEELADQPIYVLRSVWEKLSPGVADRVLLEFELARATELLVALDPGICAAILSRISKERREAYLGAMSPEIAAEIRDLLDYPTDSAGRLMDTRIVAFNASVTVADAIAQLRRQKTQPLASVFILNDEMQVTGEVDMQRLALATPEQELQSLSKPIRAFALALDPRNEVAEKMEAGRLQSLPVLDGNERLIGIVDEAAIVDTLRESVSADLQTMVGASKDERALSSAWFAVKKRQPWLQINLLTAFLAAAVVGMFEDTIARYTALAILLPIAAGQSGNTGAQALAVTMRGLTLREITVRHWLRVLMKESGAAVINGVAIAITCGLGVLIWSRSLGLALIIALAMISSMTIAAAAGALVPIALKKLGQDPALSSSIILTTITDIAGFISFLGIATLLSGMLDG